MSPGEEVKHDSDNSKPVKKEVCNLTHKHLDANIATIKEDMGDMKTSVVAVQTTMNKALVASVGALLMILVGIGSAAIVHFLGL